MDKPDSPVGKRGHFHGADRVIKTGFWINAVLMAMKLGAGFYGNSEAVFADGLESGCDLVAIAATYFAVRMGSQPQDRSHPYGHGRAESIAAIFVSIIIVLTGAGIIMQASRTILAGKADSPGIVAVLAAVATIAVKEWLYRYTRKTGDRLESPALLALAGDHRKDALTSIATLVGVSGAFFGLRIMDPIAAGLTALFHSTARLPMHRFTGGPLNVKLHPSSVAGPRGLEAMAAALGKACTPHMSGGGLGYLYNIQLVSAVPNAGTHHEFKGLQTNVQFECKTSPLQVVDGKIKVPTGPGFGVDIDPEWVKKHQVVKL